MENTIGFIGFQVARLGRNQGGRGSAVNLLRSRVLARGARPNGDGSHAAGDRRKIWHAITIAIDCSHLWDDHKQGNSDKHKTEKWPVKPLHPVKEEPRLRH